MTLEEIRARIEGLLEERRDVESRKDADVVFTDETEAVAVLDIRRGRKAKGIMWMQCEQK